MTLTSDTENTSVEGVYNRTDLGNAERLVAQHGAELRYCHTWSKWLVWDGARWRIDDNGHAEQLAQETTRSILNEALAAQGDQRKRLLNHAFTSEKSSRIRGMLDLARAQPGVPVRPADLDRDPMRLNVVNGTLDLRTLNLEQHQREDLNTKLAPVHYDPDAQAPRWHRFLQEIFDGDQELIGFVQRAAGYSLTGDTSAQIFFLLHGTGENGKSKFLETIRHMLGDYAQHAPAETFLERKYTGIPNDVARLQGARFVTAIETGENRRLDEAKVKHLTGGDAVTARYMRSEFFEFAPLFKVWLATNHKPTIKGTDHAMWRRIRLIPFTRTFTGINRDDDLGEKLKSEAAGVLNWALEGLRDWLYGERLDPPTAVEEATSSYRTEQDVLGGFLEDETLAQANARAAAGALYARYKAWAETAGERPETQQSFGRRLAERGFQSTRSGRTRYWLGLRLADDADLFNDAGAAEEASQGVTR